MSALTLSGIGVRRGGRPVIERVDATFEAGRLTAVIGPNGAGKSTLLQVAAGLLLPEAGEVRLGAMLLGTIGRRELARRRAYLPQNPRVDWPISVERVIALGLTPALPAFGGLPHALQPQIEAVLEHYDLASLRTRPATALSGGELARAMLARATVGDPELLIVDEPTAGLDPRHAIAAATSLRARADAGRTVVMAVHDLDLALRFADRIVALKDGRIHAAGALVDVFSDAILGDLYDVGVSVANGAVRFR